MNRRMIVQFRSQISSPVLLPRYIGIYIHINANHANTAGCWLEKYNLVHNGNSPHVFHLCNIWLCAQFWKYLLACSMFYALGDFPLAVITTASNPPYTPSVKIIWLLFFKVKFIFFTMVYPIYYKLNITF